MDKKSFIIYQNWAEIIKRLPNEDAGELFKAICNYTTDSDYEISNPYIDALFEGQIKPQLNADDKKYQKKRERMAELNRNRHDNDTKSSRNRNDNGSDTDTDTDTVTDTDKYIKGSTASAAPLPFIDYEEVVNDYNSICVSLPRVTTISDARRKAIRARIRAYGKDKIHKAFEMAEESDFLKGSNSKNWTANFDWILNDRNLAKILDGNYANKGKAPPKQDGFEWLSQQIKEGGFT